LRKHGGAVEFDLFQYGYPDILELGTPRLTYGRLARFLDRLPREAATMRAVLGEPGRWSDGDYMLARISDSVAHLGWMYANVHAKNPPRHPPDPVRRPGDLSPQVAGELGRVNLTEREVVTAGSFESFEELNDIIERQTGRRPQIVGMVGGGMTHGD